MSQIILQATLQQFLNAVGLNRRTDFMWAEFKASQVGRRVYLINKNLSPTNDIGLAVAQRFWKWVNSTPGAHPRVVDAMRVWLDQHCKVRLCYSGSRAWGGYIVVQGELLAFHNVERGKGTWMLDHAINDGATHLDCFDEPTLFKLYTSRGFKEVRRELNHVKGQPDIVWMRKE